jgi:acetolactate synthase I/III small subunit
MAQTMTAGTNGTTATAATGTGVKKHAISLYVANKPGVLIRVAMVFARRGYNIDSLVVSSAHDPAFSQMNIEATGEEKTLGQILTQLNKLVDVVHAKDNTIEDVLSRELALIKLECAPAQRGEILQIAQAFASEAIDVTNTTITLQVSGDSQKIDSMHTVFSNYGILEMVRSGKIIIARGEHSTS